MEIKINNYTIHYIEKEANITEVVNIDYSDQILVVDEFSNSLVNEIHKSISESPSLKNTRFKDNETNLFTNSLNDLQIPVILTT